MQNYISLHQKEILSSLQKIHDLRIINNQAKALIQVLKSSLKLHQLSKGIPASELMQIKEGLNSLFNTRFEFDFNNSDLCISELLEIEQKAKDLTHDEETETDRLKQFFKNNQPPPDFIELHNDLVAEFL